MAAPIFVLGLQRSGTTWIANLLAGSGEVAAVVAEEHRGVHESVFFSHFARAFGPFEDDRSRAAFETAFAKSDYFLLSDLPRETLTQAIDRSSDYAGVFAEVMDAIAARDGCSHWLEKSPHHTLLAEDLADRFPTARFVCVTRSSASVVASRLAAYDVAPRHPRRAADIVRGALVNALYTRRLERFARRCDRALLVSYDAFVADETAGKRALCGFLGLQGPPENLRSAFAANSSHRDPSTRRLSRADRALAAFGALAGAVSPLAALSLIERRRRSARGVAWPDWVWTKSGHRPS
ncbi:MAG: sulfotransferase [Pseudomonadota bacterium]